MVKYPDGLYDFVKENMNDMDCYELADAVNEKFGIDMTYEKMRYFKHNHKLSGGKRSVCYSKTYPKEVYDFVKENHPGIPLKTMLEMVNKKFYKSYKFDCFKAWYERNHFRTGNDTRFKKGCKPLNKGQRMSDEVKERIKHTFFKPGHDTHNKRPLLSESLHKDGYVYVKLHEQGKWLKKQVVVWEAYNGPIPKGMIITNLDGDPLNCDIENLALISKKENLVMNRNNLRFENPDATKVGITLAKMNIARKEIKRGKSDD